MKKHIIYTHTHIYKHTHTRTHTHTHTHTHTQVLLACQRATTDVTNKKQQTSISDVKEESDHSLLVFKHIGRWIVEERSAR